jgi:hypothetical protein
MLIKASGVDRRESSLMGSTVPKPWVEIDRVVADSSSEGGSPVSLEIKLKVELGRIVGIAKCRSAISASRAGRLGNVQEYVNDCSSKPESIGI